MSLAKSRRFVAIAIRGRASARELRFNDNHDDKGQFAEGGGGSSNPKTEALKAKLAGLKAGNTAGQEKVSAGKSHIEQLKAKLADAKKQHEEHAKKVKELKKQIAHHKAITKQAEAEIAHAFS